MNKAGFDLSLQRFSAGRDQQSIHRDTGMDLFGRG